jgi:large subunit ribosomal protein L6
MSKIGRKPISIPSGVTFDIQASEVTVKGPKGELKVQLHPGIVVSVEADQLFVKRANEERQTKAFHGLIRSLLENQVAGVSTGYKKTLKLVGTGYRVSPKGQSLSLAVGFSHPVVIDPLPGVKITPEGTDTIHIEGNDKQAVGQMAANIRKVRPPEPYKGKGIRYEDEVVRRKQGKAAA